MLFLHNDNRELKSLKLYNKTQRLKVLFQDNNSCGILVSCAGLHSSERIQMHEQFLENNLKISKLSNKLIKILFKNNELDFLNNLLRGSIFLIEEKVITDNLKVNSLLTENKLNIILNYKALKFRFLVWNQELYRQEEALHLIKRIVNPTNNLIRTLKIHQIKML